jgi:hypothetical protein
MATKRKTSRAAKRATDHEDTPNMLGRPEWRAPDPELTQDAADRRIRAELHAAKELPTGLERWHALADLKYLVTESLLDEAVTAGAHGQSLLGVEWIVAFLAATDEVINETRSRALEQPDVCKPLVSLRHALAALRAAINGDVSAPACSPAVLQSHTWAASVAVGELQASPMRLASATSVAGTAALGAKSSMSDRLVRAVHAAVARGDFNLTQSQLAEAAECSTRSLRRGAGRKLWNGYVEVGRREAPDGEARDSRSRQQQQVGRKRLDDRSLR